MGPIKNYREEERECATTSGKFNYFSLGPATGGYGHFLGSQLIGFGSPPSPPSGHICWPQKLKFENYLGRVALNIRLKKYKKLIF